MQKLIQIFIILIILIIAHENIYSQTFGSFTDERNGYVYKTVKIGNRIWFAENMNYFVEDGCLVY